MSNGATGEAFPDDRFAEPWPAWRGPEPQAVVPREQPSANPPVNVPDEAAATFELENLRAAIAQGSALVPFLGPLITFLANGRYSFARREAAKAFNGQAMTLLLMLAAGIFGAFNEYSVMLGLWLAFGIGWVLHVIIAVVMANCGRDWLSIWNRAFHLQILPEGEPDPVRSRKRKRRHN